MCYPPARSGALEKFHCIRWIDRFVNTLTSIDIHHYTEGLTWKLAILRNCLPKGAICSCHRPQCLGTPTKAHDILIKPCRIAYVAYAFFVLLYLFSIACMVVAGKDKGLPSTKHVNQAITCHRKLLFPNGFHTWPRSMSTSWSNSRIIIRCASMLFFLFGIRKIAKLCLKQLGFVNIVNCNVLRDHCQMFHSSIDHIKRKNWLPIPLSESFIRGRHLE